jgi:AAA domain (dynein-related subfamily)
VSLPCFFSLLLCAGKRLEEMIDRAGIVTSDRSVDAIPAATITNSPSSRTSNRPTTSKDGTKLDHLVPDVLFYDHIPSQQVLMREMEQDFELGEHLLLIGNQGVGKNKVCVFCLCFCCGVLVACFVFVISSPRSLSLSLSSPSCSCSCVSLFSLFSLFCFLQTHNSYLSLLTLTLHLYVLHLFVFFWIFLLCFSFVCAWLSLV